MAPAAGDAAHGRQTTTFTNVNSIVGSAYNDHAGSATNNPNGTFEQFDGRGRSNDLIDGRGGLRHGGSTTTTRPRRQASNVQLCGGYRHRRPRRSAPIPYGSVEGIRGYQIWPGRVRRHRFSPAPAPMADRPATFQTTSTGRAADDIIIGNGNTRLQYSQSLAAVTVDPYPRYPRTARRAGDIAKRRHRYLSPGRQTP